MGFTGNVRIFLRRAARGIIPDGRASEQSPSLARFGVARWSLEWWGGCVRVRQLPGSLWHLAYPGDNHNPYYTKALRHTNAPGTPLFLRPGTPRPAYATFPRPKALHH